MLSADDRTRMRADLLAVRNDRPVSIAIRRNGATLAAQTVRVARSGTGRTNVTDSAGAQASIGLVTVLGDTTLNIQPGDKFTAASILYEIVAVHPNRDAAVMAEARIIE